MTYLPCVTTVDVVAYWMSFAVSMCRCVESQACINARDEWNESRIGGAVNEAASVVCGRLRHVCAQV